MNRTPSDAVAHRVDRELIAEVVVKPLRLIPDARGFLTEMLRADWPEFERFAQAYVTAAYPGVYKAWHRHRLQTDHFVCVHGMARVVLYDPREDSPTRGFAYQRSVRTGKMGRIVGTVRPGSVHWELVGSHASFRDAPVSR